MDLSTISTLLTSLKTATDIAKAIRESDVSLEKAESKLRLAELMSAIADAKIEASNVQQTLLDKEAAIRKLEEQLQVKAQLVWEQPYYWHVNGSQKEGPYCQQCYDKDKALIRLQGNGSGFWQCKTCKSNYTDKTYQDNFSRPLNYRGHDPYA